MLEKRPRTRRSRRETKRRGRRTRGRGGRGGEERHLSIALEGLRHGDCIGEKRLPSSSFRSVEQATAAAARRQRERWEGGREGGMEVWRMRGMAEILSVWLRLTLKVKYELAWAFN